MQIDQPDLRNYRLIPIADDHVAIVDDYDYDWLKRYKWILVRHQKSFYAKTPIKKFGVTVYVAMHTMVAKTPRSLCCHHRNRNTLDNRNKNLINLTRPVHRAIHKNNTLLFKFSIPAPHEVDLSQFY